MDVRRPKLNDWRATGAQGPQNTRNLCLRSPLASRTISNGSSGLSSTTCSALTLRAVSSRARRGQQPSPERGVPPVISLSPRGKTCRQVTAWHQTNGSCLSEITHGRREGPADKEKAFQARAIPCAGPCAGVKPPEGGLSDSMPYWQRILFKRYSAGRVLNARMS